MAKNSREILSDAVARNSAMVLSLPSAGMLRHHKSRFLQEVDQGVWVEAVLAERALIDELITGGKPCGISFKTGDQKISFLATPLILNTQFQMNADTILPAVLIAPPAEVKIVQRRNNYRAAVPSDSDLRIQVWRIPEYVRLKDKPNKAAELAVALRDISAGGIGVAMMPKDGLPPKVLPDERLRVVLKFGEAEELLIEGRMRTPRPVGPNEILVTGIQFKGLEEGLEGRRILTELTAIVGTLQREEARRHRMGI